MTFTHKYYKITHTYSRNPNETDYYIRTYLDLKETTEALLTIQFKSEELDINEEGIEISDYEFKHILQRYFPIDVITQKPSQSYETINMYTSREANCGKNYFMLMKTPIANSPYFIQDVQRANDLTLLQYTQYFMPSEKI